MNLATILELSAACIGVFSGLFFCIGILHVKRDRVDALAVKMWDKGKVIAEEMTIQKADFIFGSVLMLLSFLIQFVIKAFPMYFSQEAVHDPLHGVAISIAIATAIAFVCRITSSILGKIFLQQLRSRIAEE